MKYEGEGESSVGMIFKCIWRRRRGGGILEIESGLTNILF